MQTKTLLKRRTTLGLWVAIGVVIAIAVVSGLYWRNVLDDNRLVQHTHFAIAQIAWIMDDLQTAETHARGYVLTGERTFLRPYQIALVTFQPHLQLLRTAIQDNPVQRRNIDQLARLAQEQIHFMNAVIALRRDRGFAPARNLIASSPDSQSMNAFRQVGGAMEDEENRLLTLRQDSANTAALELLGVVLGGSFILLFLVAGSAITIQRDLARREQLQENLRQGRQELLQRQEEIQELNVRLRRAMAETHHRVKNNLQVIAALTEMQVDGATTTVPVSALRRVEQHVQMLAAVHDLLTREAKENESVEFLHTRDVVEKLRPLLESVVGKQRLHFTVDDLRLPIRQGTSLAVLINELVSNAVKHGGGEIALSLTGTADQGRLEVRDNGPGFPPDFDPRAAANTGLELIDSLGRWDLGGELTFQNHPEGGARVIVTFPLKTATEVG